MLIACQGIVNGQEQTNPTNLRSRASDVIARSVESQPPKQADAFQKLMFGRDPITNSPIMIETGKVGQLNAKILKDEMEQLDVEHIRREQRRKLAGVAHKIDMLILKQEAKEVEFEKSEAERRLSQKRAQVRLERFEKRCESYCNSMFKLTVSVKSGEALNTLLDKLSDRALYYKLEDMAGTAFLENSYLLNPSDVSQIVVKTPNLGTGSRVYSLVEPKTLTSLSWPFLLRQPEFNSKRELFEREWISFQEKEQALSDDELMSLINRHKELVNTFYEKHSVKALQNDSVTNIKLFLMAEGFLKNIDRELSKCLLTDPEARPILRDFDAATDGRDIVALSRWMINRGIRFAPCTEQTFPNYQRIATTLARLVVAVEMVSEESEEEDAAQTKPGN